MASALPGARGFGFVKSGRGGIRRERRPITRGKRTIMDKWRIAKNSTIIRIAASAGTIVAVAALAGAGFKW
jgi:hypothetical protein